MSLIFSDIATSNQAPIRRYFYLCMTVVLSLAYGFFLATLPIDAFLDRDNYIKYAENSIELLIYYKDIGVYNLLFNEPVWLLLNVCLNYFFDDAYIVLRFYIFFAAVVTSFVMLKFGAKYFFFVSLALFFPQVIKNDIVHLRQGVAIAFFLACFLMDNRLWRYILMCFLPFIHASFFFVLVLFILDVFGRKVISNVYLRFLILVFLSFSLIFSVDYFGRIFGARQVNEYFEVAIEVSGLGFIFWILIFGLFISQGKMFIDKYFFPLSILFFYLVSYFFLPISARIFESVFIFILFMGLALNSMRRYIFMILLTIYSVAQYISSWNDPWLGFGV